MLTCVRISDVLHISRQSAYLVGRDKSVVDIYVEHPSCSKQHAAIQCEHGRLLIASHFPCSDVFVSIQSDKYKRKTSSDQ